MSKIKVTLPSGKTLSVGKPSKKLVRAATTLLKTFYEQVCENRGYKVHKPKKK